MCCMQACSFHNLQDVTVFNGHHSKLTFQQTVNRNKELSEQIVPSVSLILFHVLHLLAQLLLKSQ